MKPGYIFSSCSLKEKNVPGPIPVEVKAAGHNAKREILPVVSGVQIGKLVIWRYE